jgi:hypothetical protein
LVKKIYIHQLHLVLDFAEFRPTRHSSDRNSHLKRQREKILLVVSP